jgi:subtilase family serine protease
MGQRLLFVLVMTTSLIVHAEAPTPHAHRGFAAGNPWNSGYVPSQIRSAYQLDQLSNQGQGQMIAIVDAFTDPNIAQEVAVFSQAYGLPPADLEVQCPTGVGPQNTGWHEETALDVEWAHAAAPLAKILLVESVNAGDSLYQAVDYAVARGASVVSMSWGTYETANRPANYDVHFARGGVTFIASTGDAGADQGRVQYPASSSYVLAVGGTTLQFNASGAYQTAWAGGGGGVSRLVRRPAYQNGIVNRAFRTIPDISLVANPNTGASVYNTLDGWAEWGGTSLAAPLAAGMVALINASRGGAVNNIHNAFYGLYPFWRGDLFQDIVSGCDGYGHCSQPGYDFVTGLGAPHANWAAYLSDLFYADSIADVAVSSPTGLFNLSSPAFFFFSGGTGFQANSQGHFCAVSSWPQWLAMGGPASGAPTFNPLPTWIAFDGACRLPQGFFFSGPAGYYANGSGQYCLFSSWDQWLKDGGPAKGYPNFPIPSSMQYVGSCP